MTKQFRAFAGVVAVTALALVMPLTAQQPAAAAQQKPVGTAGMAEPSKDNPLKFTAVNVNLQAGRQTVTEIHVERWTTPAERAALIKLVDTAKLGEAGQQKLLDALQNIEPRTGYIKTPNSLGWDLKYAWANTLDDGSRQIVIVTDKPVSFQGGVVGAEAQDYPFTLIEMRMKPNEKGEGKMLTGTSITTKDGKIALENYGLEPVRLTSITEEK